MLNHGSLVISLDFEMMWGCHDWATVDNYGYTNIRHVRAVITRLLNLFQQYDVHATFATVGLLFCVDKDDALFNKPLVLPTYLHKHLSPYRQGYIESIKKEDEHLYFASDIIDQLKEYPNIEIGTHTYSHYFCWEKGQNIAQFQSDLSKAVEVGMRSGVKIHSIVFPKNEVSDDYLKVCSKFGIISYRGNAKKYFSKPSNSIQNCYLKAARLLDAYINLGGATSYSYQTLDKNAVLVNIPASRMLRPYVKRLKFLEGWRLRRIKHEMLYAAQHNELYHLWWHPHNFGTDMEENFLFLEKVLKFFNECRNSYGMKSYSMAEFTREIKK